MARNKPVVVVGLMGAGKTTVAVLVAQALGLPLSDSDPYLRQRYGKSAAEIAATEGADVLHEREAEHVLDALGHVQVVTAAASVIERPEVRQALRKAFVIWLDTTPEVLAERMKSSDHRPGFDPAVMKARRDPYFREVADLRLDVTTALPQELADKALDAIR
ncbi:shikimate kinase [Nonomuraea sp. NPDC059194]|uniref:shikimate kinase n=1 Tax=Nonomuraea sp. NPDC059194 TaxID=3346764 RepID=UPI0036A29CDC